MLLLVGWMSGWIGLFDFFFLCSIIINNKGSVKEKVKKKVNIKKKKKKQSNLEEKLSHSRTKIVKKNVEDC